MPPPLTSDPIDILLAHNHWATRRVLELCRPLTREQFRRSFPIGPGENGGLHATLAHIVGCMLRWADRIADRPLRPSIEAEGTAGAVPERTVDEFAELLDAATAELGAVAGEARRRGLSTPIEVRFGSEPTTYTFSRGAALMHVITHGHYHRAQCMNMLRRLEVPGVSDRLPDLDVCDWQHEAEVLVAERQ